MLETHTFKNIVEHAPLVSIDLCLMCKDQLLLGKRKNEPMRGEWFTPGGRIHKGEAWQDCLKRLAYSEVGIVVNDIGIFYLMGVWDHFYPNSFLASNISTHYVNLPHYCCFEERPRLTIDDQHSTFRWIDLQEIRGNSKFHEYVRNYASWLIARRNKND